MKKYHFVVAIFCLALAFFYLKNNLIMSKVGTLIGTQVQIPNPHLNYLTGFIGVLILAYLIRNQES